MNVQVIFLGPSRTFAGTGSAEVAVADGSDVAALRQALSDRFDSLAPALPTIRFAVNNSFVEDDTVLNPGDEVALIPPVSGG